MGGIEIPHDRELVGHSDADVLLHAITDAVLGAAALGDIGQLFPDTAAENANRDSAEMLALAWQRVTSVGYQLENLDCVVLTQRPKLGPHREAMATRVAEILGCVPGQIGIKAKTGEGVGPIGNEEIITAQCVALLTKAD